jgi:hypothetical protein
VVLDVSAPVACVPLSCFAPAQPLDAVQPVALAALQVKVAESPASTLADDAFKVTTGAEIVGSPPPPQAARLTTAATQIHPNWRIASLRFFEILASHWIYCI